MMRRICIALLLVLGMAGQAWSVPEIVSLRVADVTPTSLSLVWMTNVAAEPAAEIFADVAMAEPLLDLGIEAYPDLPGEVAAAALDKGIFLLRVTGLEPDTSYFLRAVTREMNNAESVAYSELLEVKTSATVIPYQTEPGGELIPLANDLLGFQVYVRPVDQGTAAPGQGEMLLLESEASFYPVSAVVGAGAAEPEGLVDLNNLYGLNRESLAVLGGEKVTLRIYRGSTLSVLTHLRRVPTASGQLQAVAGQKGFSPADLNLDGVVNYEDFLRFKAHHGQAADDAAFNPDLNFMGLVPGETSAGDAIDIRDFAWFAGQYGKTE